MVLDAEVVAVDRAAHPGPCGATVLRAFQELSTRARGDITAAQVPLPRPWEGGGGGFSCSADQCGCCSHSARTFADSPEPAGTSTPMCF